MFTLLRSPTLLVLAVASFMLQGCGESDSERLERLQLMDEAQEVGFAMGLAERCGLEHQWSRNVPSRYDDSLGDSITASAFQSGYAEARGLDQPCIYGISGRAPRR
jgi:hypothetical protein